MDRGFTVRGDDGPAILEGLGFVHAHVDHGLDGYDHARFQQYPFARRTEVWHRGLFPQAAADTMAAVFPNDAVFAPLADPLLNRVGDVPQAVARLRVGDPRLQRFAPR